MSAAVSPYGTWASPFGAAQAGTASTAMSFATAQGGRLTWIEGRPAEKGRNVLVALGDDGTCSDITPEASSVRTRVHEYGGLPYACAGGRTVFSCDDDQLLYLLGSDGAARPLTLPGYRFADGCVSTDGAHLYCVREDHTGVGEARNTIVAIDLDAMAPSAGSVLFDRSDFVAYPRVSPDGRQLAFVSWVHPDMPFDATTLHVGTIGRDGLTDLRAIVGKGAGRDDESVIEPQWDRDTLYFLSDRSGYWNLYRAQDGRVEAITAFEADLGGPLWQLGAATFGLTGDGQALVRATRNAFDELLLVDLATGRTKRLELPFVAFGSVGLLDANTAHAVASSAAELPQLITIDLDGGNYRVVRCAGALDLADDFVSRAEPIEFPTVPAPDGTPRAAHAFFFPPRNPNFRAPVGAKPPLIVTVHGGPTSHSVPAFAPNTQFWTTRGFAVVSVNYGGSSGYGRAYRERLRGQWGVLDLQDAVAAVDYLVATGRVDPHRVAIRGGSAGGLTVLSALAFTDRFNAGINYFGVADLEGLARDTHKFESRYCDSLIAPWPDGIEVYRARSPINHVDKFRAPLITFQGSEDLAVPPSQSRAIVEAMRAKGLPVAYFEFAGEQHGFRDARNIARAFEAELYFLGRVFGFAPADAIVPVPIDNLPAEQGASAR